jgi:hypothetical protein
MVSSMISLGCLLTCDRSGAGYIDGMLASKYFNGIAHENGFDIPR